MSERDSLEILLSRRHGLDVEVKNLAAGLAAFGRAAGIPADLYGRALQRALRHVDAESVTPAPTRPVEPRPAPDALDAAPKAEAGSTGNVGTPVGLIWYDRKGQKRADVRFDAGNVSAWAWKVEVVHGREDLEADGSCYSFASAVRAVVAAIGPDVALLVVVPEWARDCGGTLQLCRWLLRNALEHDGPVDVRSFLQARSLLDELCKMGE